MTSMTSRTEYSTQTQKTSTLFSCQYLRNHWTLDIGFWGYIGIVWPKEHSPEVRSFPPGTPCIWCLCVCMYVCMYVFTMTFVPLRGTSLTDALMLQAASQSPTHVSAESKNSVCWFVLLRSPHLSDNHRHFQPLLHCACWHSLKYDCPT